MANALPIVVAGAPNIRIEESPSEQEYYGYMTYLRIDGIGEAQEDPRGLILQLCGRYNPDMLERLALFINGKRT